MDATIKATPKDVVLRVGHGSMHIRRRSNNHAEVRVFLAGGQELVCTYTDPALIDALCVLVGEAHNST
jgi:hypothetical protein